MDASVPLAAALVVAIFAGGAGYIIGLAFPTRDGPAPDEEPPHPETIEQRARKQL